MEKIYQFNEFLLSYDKRKDDISCLTICRTKNGSTYVMSHFFDKDADIICMILDDLQKAFNELTAEIKELKNKYYEADNDRHVLFEQKRKTIEYIKDSGITFLNLANQRCFCNNNCADRIINLLIGGDKV